MPAKPVSKRSEAYGKHLPTLDNDPWKVLYCAFADTSLAVTVLMFGAVCAMHGLRVALLVVNGIISLTGIAANLILLVIIYVATPKPIRTYSVLIINYAVTDLFTSMAQAITIPRMVLTTYRPIGSTSLDHLDHLDSR
ncbi:hypothetical protein RB195_002807 [Necator americanus]|uniref:G-protein coupled receptors family 1 profile domain-containing protein n=1 Tax=Necator americanus TaxID=51031 RepID=A0ABR1DKR6_NECAM